MNAPAKDALVTDVVLCARCGGDHRDVVFFKFTRKPEESKWTHWGACPELQEPILLRIVQTDGE